MGWFSENTEWISFFKAHFFNFYLFFSHFGMGLSSCFRPLYSKEQKNVTVCSPYHPSDKGLSPR